MTRQRVEEAKVQLKMIGENFSINLIARELIVALIAHADQTVDGKTDERTKACLAYCANLATSEIEDTTAEDEQARWQKAIYDLLCSETNSECNIDGGGCDSGDPLDFTLAEISQALAHFKNKLDLISKPQADERADACLAFCEGVSGDGLINEGTLKDVIAEKRSIAQERDDLADANRILKGAVDFQNAAKDLEIARLNQLVCDFQASGMINAGGMKGPCEVTPIHIEQHVTALRAQIVELKSALAKPSRDGWVSVEDRLPEKAGQYICFNKWRDSIEIRLLHFEEKHWFKVGEEGDVNDADHVTHWRPLPEAP